MYHILSTNILDVTNTKGLQSKSDEISVAIKTDAIGQEYPKLYAFRYGMAYDPENEFKPNVPPNHKIDAKLQNAFYDQRDAALKAYKELLKRMNTGEQGEQGEQVDELKRKLEQKQIRIDEQAAKIAELSAKKSESKEGDQIAQLQEMIKTLASVQNNRIEIKIGEKNTKIIEKIVHEKFPKIITLLSKEQAVYMYGAAGTGKSEIAKQVSEALELDFYPASTITQEFKLTGYMDANGVYRETNFYKAMKSGGVFFLDEMDSCTPDVLVGINGALANGYFDFPHETVTAHNDFRVIAAGNTIGRGGDADYTGRFPLDISTLDRFWGMKIDYSPLIDKAVANNDMELVEFAQQIRKASEETGITILMSYRSIGRIANFQDVFTIEEIMDMAVIKGMAEDDVRMLARNMAIPTENKYFQAFRKAV